MTYQPLARKYRPSRFGHMVGQDSVARALANAICIGREPHALLFTGVRGVGKTTVARLYAKALNCPDRSPDGEPCDLCDSCHAVTNGSHEDVMEIDGASNTSVNDVRVLQETIHYVPQRSKFRVYIIDEVHMLSQAAFNALLKTLEEPPSHVVFVFATTEVHKVPETILSRCQTFYLKKLSRQVIQDRLATILGWENLKAENQALAMVAREGHGSMRDALTLLDQAIALSEGVITVGTLESIVSHQSSTLYLELLKCLVLKDVKGAFVAIGKLDQGGAEFIQVAEETASLARHGFVLKSLGDRLSPGVKDSGASELGSRSFELEALGLDDQELRILQELVDQAKPFDLNRIFRTLIKSREDLDGSNLDRFIFENYVFEWCLDPGFADIEGLLGGLPSTAARDPKSSAPQGERRLSPNPVVLHAPSVATKPPAGDHRASSPPAASAAASSAAPASTLQSSPPPSESQQGMLAPQKAAPAVSHGQWPATWRELLDAWRVHKPLFARKLEDVHVLEYTPTRVVLAVNASSYSSKSLLQVEEQRRIADQLKELFSFQGQLLIRQASTAEQQSAGETVLDARQKEAELQRQRHLADARQSPLVQALTSSLGATIEDVRIQEGKSN